MIRRFRKIESYTINNELIDKIKNIDRDYPVYVKLHRPVYKDTIYGCFLSPTTVVNEGVFKDQILVIIGGNLQTNMWSLDDNFIVISEEEFVEHSYKHLTKYYPSVNVRKDGIKEIVKLSFEKLKNLKSMQEVTDKKLTVNEKEILLSHTQEDILNFQKDFKEAFSKERREQISKEIGKLHDRRLVLNNHPFFVASLIKHGYKLEV